MGERTTMNISKWIAAIIIMAALSSNITMVDSRLMPRKTDYQQPETRIVGGKEVQDSDEFPFFVNLASCSGSLIHGDIVLTAAHVRLLRMDFVCAAFRMSNFLTTVAWLPVFAKRRRYRPSRRSDTRFDSRRVGQGQSNRLRYPSRLQFTFARVRLSDTAIGCMDARSEDSVAQWRCCGTSDRRGTDLGGNGAD